MCRLRQLQVALRYQQRALTLRDNQALLRSIEQDSDLDGWRQLLESLRLSLLHASRIELLAAYELLLQDWLRTFLQDKIIDVSGGEDTSHRVLSQAERQRPGLVAIIDTDKHPRTWKITSVLAAQLDAIVNYCGDGLGVCSAHIYI